MKRILLLSILLLLTIVLLDSCSSGKKQLQFGNYEESVRLSIKRLRKSPNNKKATETLREAYPYAVDFHLDNIRKIKETQGRFKWDQITRSYSMLNKLHNDLMRCPRCRQIIPDSKDFLVEYEEAAILAAEERYVAGVEAMNGNTRETAKEAYKHFKRVEELKANYKDTRQRMNDALWMATLKVVVEPIPVVARNLEISAEFFENKFHEYIKNNNINEFVRFFTIEEAQSMNIDKPDHIIIMNFDEFAVGQVYFKEKEIQAINDSVVVATYFKEVDSGSSSDESHSSDESESKVTICHRPPGNDKKARTIQVSQSALQAHINHGDAIGACEGDEDPDDDEDEHSDTMTDTDEPEKVEVKVYTTVKARLTVYTNTITSYGVLDFKIIDANTNSVVSQEKMPGEFIWQSSWANFNGDERALTSEQLQLTRLKEVHPPPPQALFIEFTQPIFGQMVGKVRNFYRYY